MGVLSNSTIPEPYVPLTSSNREPKPPLFKLQPTGWRVTKISIEQHLGYIGWLWSDEMNRRTAFAKSPNEWPLIEHNMCGHQAARSPLWRWPCLINCSPCSPCTSSYSRYEELWIYSSFSFHIPNNFKTLCKLSCNWMQSCKPYVLLDSFVSSAGISIYHWCHDPSDKSFT